jgi:hypothetical protein
MDAGSIYYLGVTLVLFGLFAGIVVRVCRKDRKERNESAKYRMMDHD